MSAGAFETALQNVNPRPGNRLIKGALFAAACAAVDIAVCGFAVLTVAPIAIAILVIICVVVCGQMVKRGGGTLPLSRMYLLRGVVATSGYALILCIIGALHLLIAKFDARFRLDGEVVAIAAAVIVVSAFAVFLIRHRPHTLEFAGELRSGPIGVAELDELYSPSALRAPKVGTAITSAAAMFGAYVVAKSSVFALFYVFVEALMLVLFLRTCIALAYEAGKVLDASGDTVVVQYR